MSPQKPVEGVTDEYPATYIAGPMTGYDNWNTPAFERMAKRLRAAGLQVISPHELHAADANISREWYLRRDLREVVSQAGRIVFLQGWERSWGARLEHAIGEALGLELVYPHEVLDFLEAVTGCPSGVIDCEACSVIHDFVGEEMADD